jgi:hypothetical protein
MLWRKKYYLTSYAIILVWRVNRNHELPGFIIRTSSWIKQHQHSRSIVMIKYNFCLFLAGYLLGEFRFKKVKFRYQTVTNTTVNTVRKCILFNLLNVQKQVQKHFQKPNSSWGGWRAWKLNSMQILSSRTPSSLTTKCTLHSKIKVKLIFKQVQGGQMKAGQILSRNNSKTVLNIVFKVYTLVTEYISCLQRPIVAQWLQVLDLWQRLRGQS